MKWSSGYLFTLKEAPADAEIPSHVLLMRAGYIRKLAPGIFNYGPLMLKAIRKFETIVREEMDKRGCLEMLMPMVQPRELWEETDRWQQMGEGLQKLKNRNGHDFCLGATHEEVVTDFVRKDVKSYRDLPFVLFQIQTKFRDEIRPRFGLLRGREFIMKDAYSFDVSKEGAQLNYQKMYEAYTAIFQRLGVKFCVVKADSGNIGGNQSEEFHILADSGEDQLLVGEQGKFAANVEVCEVFDSKDDSNADVALERLEEFATPGVKTIAELSLMLKIEASRLVKTLFFLGSDDPKDFKPVAVCLRGDHEVNPVKLKNLLGLANPPRMLSDEEVKQVAGASPGSCGPVGLKIPIYLDKGVSRLKNWIVGANRDGFHLRGVNPERDFTAQTADLRMAKEGDLSPDGKERLVAYRGIEVGHIFYLGTKYSKLLNATFLDMDGKPKPIEMGCYGIGITRTVQAVIEQSHDGDGMIWPLALAPFPVHICLLDPADEKVAGYAAKIYDALRAQGVEVLMDDRNERPGVKFKDADLLGMPLRLNIGARGLASGEVEMIDRKTKTLVKLPEAQALDRVLERLKVLAKEPTSL